MTLIAGVHHLLAWIVFAAFLTQNYLLISVQEDLKYYNY